MDAPIHIVPEEVKEVISKIIEEAGPHYLTGFSHIACLDDILAIYSFSITPRQVRILYMFSLTRDERFNTVNFIFDRLSQTALHALQVVANNQYLPFKWRTPIVLCVMIGFCGYFHSSHFFRYTQDHTSVTNVNYSRMLNLKPYLKLHCSRVDYATRHGRSLKFRFCNLRLFN